MKKIGSILLKYWLKFAHILGVINTKIILTLIFFIFFTPLGLFMKLFRIDILTKKISFTKDSYWINRKEKPEELKYQF